MIYHSFRAAGADGELHEKEIEADYRLIMCEKNQK
jgi:hypothetical protein